MDDELDSVLLNAIDRLRGPLVGLGMPADLDDRAAVAWLRARLELGWDLELEGSAPGYR